MEDDNFDGETRYPWDLKRNRKLEKRWGAHYYTGIKDCLFDTKSIPYTPEEYPPSLCELIEPSQPLYTCNHCNDCYRFKSSYEAHINRRSWLLGFWCYHCFFKNCSHGAKEGAKCSSCTSDENNRRCCLKLRGLKKGQRVGCVKVFFNKCAFFEHLRAHENYSFDIADLMLLPIPSGIKNAELEKLETVCEALMEQAFVDRMHIADWLKIRKIEGTWWKLNDKEHSSVKNLIKTYEDHKANKHNANAIAFVDCGPTATVFAPEYCEMDKGVKRKLDSFESTNVRTTPKLMATTTKSNPSVIAVKKFAPNPQVSQPTNAKLNKQTIVCNSAAVDAANRRLTVTSSRNVDFSHIIKQLPPELLANKKIVFVDKDANKWKKDEKSETTNKQQFVPILPKNCQTIYPQEAQVIIRGSQAFIIKPKTSINSMSKTVFQNSLVLPNFANVNVASQEDKKSEVSKINQIVESKNIPLYVDFNPDTGEFIELRWMNDGRKTHCDGARFRLMNYREGMIKGLKQLQKFELREMLRHVKEVNAKYIELRGVQKDEITKSNLKMMKLIEDSMIAAAANNVVDPEIYNEESITKYNDWEKDFKSVKGNECSTCKKIKKPPSYVVGLSKPAKDECLFCSCYNNVCFKCDTCCGESVRFNMHLRYHNKESPYCCPSCYKEFPSEEELQVHSWNVCMHPLIKRIYGCKICQLEGFPDEEAVARHCYLMHTYKKIKCGCCREIFNNVKSYKTHRAQKHAMCKNETTGPKKVIACSLADCLLDGKKFIEHVESNVGIYRKIFFKCIFCPFYYTIGRTGKELMKHHLFKNHLQHYAALFSKDALPRALPLRHLRQLPPDHTNNNIGRPIPGQIVPKIVSTRTITPEIFEQKSNDSTDASKSSTLANSTEEPKRSEPWKIHLSKPKSQSNSEENASEPLPKITDVRSMANETISNPDDKSDKEALLAPDEIKTEPKTDADASSSGHLIRDASAKEKILELSKKQKITLIQVVDVSKDSKEDDASKPPNSTKSPGEEAHSVTISKVKNSSKGNEVKKKLDFNYSKSEIIRICKEQKVNLGDNVTLQPISKASPSRTVTPTEKVIAPNNPSQSSAIKRARPQGKPLSRTKPGPLSRLKTMRPLSKRRIEKPWRIAFNAPTDSARGPPLVFRCHICKEMIDTSSSSIKEHFDKRHTADYVLAVLRPKLERLTDDFVKLGCKKNVLPDENTASNQSTVGESGKKKAPQKKTETKRSPKNASLGMYIEKESPKDKEGKFRCKKCEALFDSMPTLREHIAQNHRLKGRFLICLECGDNFMVASSLHMHLNVYHGIADPISYMTENPDYAPDVVGSHEAEGKALIDNQCQVCKAVFESKSAVDKHFRVHGMAFLSRKIQEARKASKTPEKAAPHSDSSPEKVTDDSSSAKTTPEKSDSLVNNDTE